MKNNQAFTLIELLVVVLIIGILAAVALPQYQKAVAKARLMDAITTMKALSDAEEVYYMANGTFTTVLDDLDLGVQNESEYYTYSCFDSNWPSCIARPKKDGYPALEFVFSTHQNHAGKHWCQTLDARNILTTEGIKKANALCKTFGTQETSLPESYGPYYLIQ